MGKFYSISSALKGRLAPRLMTLPGSDGVRVAIRLLTDDESDGCRRRAIHICETNKVNLALDPDYFERVLTREMISTAYLDADTVDGDSPEPFFSDQGEVAELDSSTIRQLWCFYEEHLQEADPLLYLDEEQALEVATLLEKEQRAKEMLSNYDARSLLTLVLSMAALLRKYQRPSSTTS